MPNYSQSCNFCKNRFEFYSALMTSDDPACPKCGGETGRIFHAPGVIWSKPLVAYGDATKENYSRDNTNGGFWVNERDSDRAREAGHPVSTFISTPQEQAAYCKREGLMNPRDLPSNLSVTKDGAGWETANRSEI